MSLTRRHSNSLFCALILFVSASLSAARPTNPLATANHLVQTGHADDAIRALRTIVASEQQNGPAQLLLCRAYFSEEAVDDAIPACEAAVSAMPASSTAEDWLGRAYGLKADGSGPIAGLRLATKVRDAFEAAVRLNPRDSEAVNDLAEFYIGAPGMIGGGVDKAEALADRAEATLPQNAHRIRALAAEKQGNNARAESEFRAAVGVGGHPAAWVDLGHFCARRKQIDAAVDALSRGVAADRAADASLVDAAEVLINDAHTRPDIAEQWLRAYLTGNGQSDAAPVFRVYTDLARLAHKRGDKTTGQAEAARALALASHYEPAQKLSH